MLRIEVRHPLATTQASLLPSQSGLGKEVEGNTVLTTSGKDLAAKKEKKSHKAVDENERVDSTGIAQACAHSLESCLIVLPLLNLRPVDDEWLNLHFPLDLEGVLTVKFDYWDVKSLHNITHSADVSKLTSDGGISTTAAKETGDALCFVNFD